MGSFNQGLRVLTDAIGAKLQGEMHTVLQAFPQLGFNLHVVAHACCAQHPLARRTAHTRELSPYPCCAVLVLLPVPLCVCTADKVRLNWKLTSISTTPDGLYRLSYDTPEGPASLTTRSVALTIPAWALADLLKEQAPAAAQALASVDYPPVGAVTLAYPVSAVKDDRKAADGSVPGFGQLHPRSQVCFGRGMGELFTIDRDMLCSEPVWRHVYRLMHGNSKGNLCHTE